LSALHARQQPTQPPWREAVGTLDGFALAEKNSSCANLVIARLGQESDLPMHFGDDNDAEWSQMVPQSGHFYSTRSVGRQPSCDGKSGGPQITLICADVSSGC
jgi:hypothetical protein